MAHQFGHVLLNIWSCYVDQGAPDLKAGREVAEFLGTVHHEFEFTIQVYNLIEIVLVFSNLRKVQSNAADAILIIIAHRHKKLDVMV